jgi:hypothetical protein
MDADSLSDTAVALRDIPRISDTVYPSAKFYMPRHCLIGFRHQTNGLEYFQTVVILINVAYLSMSIANVTLGPKVTADNAFPIIQILASAMLLLLE